MSGTVDLARLYAAIEQAARLVDAPCARDRVWPVLTAYGDLLDQAVIAFRVATAARRAGELDCRFTMLPRGIDPYARAVQHGLVRRTDHPADALPADVADRCPVDCSGIDFGVVDGFTKTWLFFPPDDLQDLSRLAEVPSMPPGLARHLGFFARHGLDDRASLFGIDHRHRTVNVYFGEAPAECFVPATVRAMLREMELPDPSEEMLGLAERAFGVYVTLGWDSPRIERVTYAVMTADPTTLPTRLGPTIEHFVRSAPWTGDAGDRRFVYAVTSSGDGEYRKLQSYYRWRPRMANLMLLPGSAGTPG